MLMLFINLPPLAILLNIYVIPSLIQVQFSISTNISKHLLGLSLVLCKVICSHSLSSQAALSACVTWVRFLCLQDSTCTVGITQQVNTLSTTLPEKPHTANGTIQFLVTVQLKKNRTDSSKPWVSVVMSLHGLYNRPNGSGI